MPAATPAVEDARPSRVPLVVGVLLAAGTLGAGVALVIWASRPAICADTNVTSERFGYCISVPEGWHLAATDGEGAADQLFRVEGDTTIMIQAVDTRRDLPSFADDIRRLQTDNGLNVEEIEAYEVAGVEALRWDATLAASGNITDRTVVFAREGIVWKVEFADSTEAFDSTVGDLGRMLSTWQFR